MASPRLWNNWSTSPFPVSKCKNEDQGLSIARVESDAERVNAVSERTWLLPSSQGGCGEPSTFKFPKPSALVAKSAFKQYSDADLKEVENEIALAGIVLNPQPVWPWITGGVVIVALARSGCAGQARSGEPMQYRSAMCRKIALRLP